MRSQKNSRYLVALSILLGMWVSIPSDSANQLRGFTVSACGPLWNSARAFQKYLSDRPTSFWPKTSLHNEALELENTLLRSQVEKLSEWISSEERMIAQWTHLQNLQAQEKNSIRPEDREFFHRRSTALKALIEAELMAIPAGVIYRTPASWNSSLWINVGEKENQMLGKTIIAKNSPVLSGTSLIGVVEYVGMKESRVRLITDAELSPAVRATRKHSPNKTFKDAYLAKGYLQGSSEPLWRSLRCSLKGVGFNFDFTDVEPFPNSETALLQKGDLLVTTGFDGVFPPDLPVGIVTRVNQPKKTSHLYELQVIPAAEHLYDLETVFVLPPRSQE